MEEPTKSTASLVIVYQETVIIEEKISYKGLTGHWSKWGGRSYDLFSNQMEGIPEVWYCQSCNSEMTNDLPPYKAEYPDGEYIRVCGNCLIDGCRKLKDRL